MFHVKFVKTFTTGHLKGISIASNVPHATLNAAKVYLDWCKEHETIAVKPIVGKAKYTIHNPEIYDDKGLLISEYKS